MTEVRRQDVFLIALDPPQGSEIRKTRPCVVVSPDEMNAHIRTVIVAPLTSTLRRYPTRIEVSVQGKPGQVALDRIRTVDKARLVRRLDRLPDDSARAVADGLRRMFAYT